MELCVVEEGSELVLQKLAGDEWADVYGFLPQPVSLIDVEVSNWWTSTHPRSQRRSPYRPAEPVGRFVTTVPTAVVCRCGRPRWCSRARRRSRSGHLVRTRLRRRRSDR